MGLKAPSNLSTDLSGFTKQPSIITKPSNITHTVPLSSETVANIRVVFGVTADHSATFRRSANIGVAITASATGLNTGGIELGTAVVSVGITSTASANVTRSGVASVSVGVTSTCTGTLVSASTTHTGTADIQVNIDIVATGEIPQVEIPDETANDNVMTLYGDPTFTSDAVVGTMAVAFDGSGDYGVIEDTFQSTFRSPFSISMWVKPDDGNPSTDQHIWSTYENPSSGVESWFMDLSLLTTGKLQWRTVKYLSGGGSDTYRKTSSSSVWGNGVASAYSHIIVTVSSSGVPVIYNGTTTVALTTDESDTLAISGWLSQEAKAKVGSFTESGYGYFAGKIDNVAVWSTSLTSSERSALYNSGSGSDLTGSSDLAGWWKMDRSNAPTTHTGTADISVGITATATGASVAGSTTHTGTASISASITASATGASVAGFANDYSLSVDGTNDHLATNFITNTHSLKDGFSSSLWVYLDDNSTTQDFFGRYGNGSARFYFGITGTKVRAAVGNAYDTTTLSHGMSTGAWYHVAYTFSGGSSGTFTYYLNGSSVGTISFTWTSDSGSYEPVHIGGLKNGSNTSQNPTNGKLDEIAFYNSALSASDITAIYNSGAPTNLSSDTDLVAYWRMEENTGSTVADSSSNSYTATLTNGPTFSTDVPFPSLYSLDFDGTDDYIEVSDHDDLSFGNSSTDSAFTMAGWVKLDSTTLQRFVTKSGSSTAEYIFGTGGGSNLLLALYDDTTSVVRYRVSSGTLSTGTWTHVAVTHSGGTIKLFINGTEDSGSSGDIGSYTAMHNSTGTVRLGGYQNGSQYTNGKLDELAVWDEALTSSEITAMASSPIDLTTNSGNYSSRDNLVAFWRLENNANDSSGNGHNGTVSSSPTYSTDTPS